MAAICNSIIGTCRSMGVAVEKPPDQLLQASRAAAEAAAAVEQ